MALVPPLDGPMRVTGPFGEDRATYVHGGLDVSLVGKPVYREPVLAPTAGEVVAVWSVDQPSRWNRQVFDGFPYGNAVAMRDAHGVVWRFLHFDERPGLAIGDAVEPGQTLGLCGSTGNSTGPHVHVDTTPGGRMDPATFQVSGARVDPLLLYAGFIIHQAPLPPMADTLLQADRDRNYDDKMAARARLATMIQAAHQLRDVTIDVERWFHDPGGNDDE